MYFVTLATDVQAYETRESAIVAAKDFSDDSPDPVEVIAEDFREVLRYSDGELVHYVLEKRPNKRAVN